MCLMKQCIATEVWPNEKKQRHIMMIKTTGAIFAVMILLINMVISGFQMPT